MEAKKKFWFFSLKEFDRFHVETKKDITKYAFRHWSKVGATSNGVRTFNLTFTAFASDEVERMKLIRLVSSIFNPPGIMSDTAGFHDLEFMTPDGGIWVTKAQVTTRPKIFDYNNENWATFQVELVAKDGSFIASKKTTRLQDQNTRMGVRFPFLLPVGSQHFREFIDYKWTNDAPMNATITAKETVNLPWLYIRTYNWKKLLTTMEFQSFQLNIGEQIVIDAYEEAVYKIIWSSKTNITDQISLNSERPRLLSPIDNKWMIASVDCWLTEQVLDIEWSYNEIWD